MTRTIVASATREIIIGFDQPFCVIGERINPTGRKKLAAEMVAGNFETVIKGVHCIGSSPSSSSRHTVVGAQLTASSCISPPSHPAHLAAGRRPGIILHVGARQ